MSVATPIGGKVTRMQLDNSAATQTASAGFVQALIQIEWPKELEPSQTDTVVIWLDPNPRPDSQYQSGEGHNDVSTYVPSPVGTANAPLSRAFGSGGLVSARVTLTGAGFDIHSTDADEWRPLEQQLSWGWSIARSSEGTHYLLAKVEVRAEGVSPEPVTMDLWRADLQIVVSDGIFSFATVNGTEVIVGLLPTLFGGVIAAAKWRKDDREETTGGSARFDSQDTIPLPGRKRSNTRGINQSGRPKRPKR
jgi:hypothetical protein